MPIRGQYQPYLYISDFWLLEKDYIVVNTTLKVGGVITPLILGHLCDDFLDVCADVNFATFTIHSMKVASTAFGIFFWSSVRHQVIIVCDRETFTETETPKRSGTWPTWSPEQLCMKQCNFYTGVAIFTLLEKYVFAEQCIFYIGAATT